MVAWHVQIDITRRTIPPTQDSYVYVYMFMYMYEHMRMRMSLCECVWWHTQRKYNGVPARNVILLVGTHNLCLRKIFGASIFQYILISIKSKYGVSTCTPCTLSCLHMAKHQTVADREWAGAVLITILDISKFIWRLKFHSLSPMNIHCFRYHYLNQWWPSLLTHICVTWS